MKKMFRAMARFIVKFPAIVIAGTIILTLALGMGASRLKVDSDMTDDIPSTIPEKAFYDEVGKTFPSNDVLIVAFSDSEGVYSARSLAQVREWTDRISDMDDVKSVLSIANAAIIKGSEDGIVIEKSMDNMPETAEEIAEFRANMEGSEIGKALIGRDGKASAMMVSVEPGTDAIRRPRFVVTLPPASADRWGELAKALAAMQKADGTLAMTRVYSGENTYDAFDAAQGFAFKIGLGEKGSFALLAVPAEGFDRKALSESVSKTCAPFGGKVAFSDSQISMYDRMNAAIGTLPHLADGKVYISGSKAVTSVIGKLMINDLATLFPIVIALIIVILFLSFRTLRGVLLPLVNVLMATVMAMGFMGWIGQPISMATMVLPIILIAVGTAYAIHVINRYYEDLLEMEDRKQAIVSTLEHVSVPILLAALTTIIGFASLSVSTIVGLQVYGLLAALGIFFALVLAVTFTPAMLILLKKPRRRTVTERNGGMLAKGLAGLGKFVARRPKTTVVISLATVLAAVVGIPLISFESNTVESFRKGTEIRESSEYLNSNFTGITIMTIVVQANEDGAILDPATLQAMEGLQAHLATLRFSGKKVYEPGDKGYEGAEDLVGGTQSITTFVKGINKALHADDPAWDKVPDAYTEVPVTTERYEYRSDKLVELDSQYGDALRALSEGSDFTRSGDEIRLPYGDMERRVSVATGKAVDLVPGRVYAGQLVFQYENSGNPENIEAFIDNPRRTARINVFVRTGSSTVSRQVQSLAREYISARFPNDARADITGLSALNLTIQQLLINTQISSVLSSLLIIFIMISLLSRSAIEGLFSIIPLTASLLINFGVMGLAGIPVDISTATIASIAIGIGIDYTLHFLERFKLTVVDMSVEDAVVTTLMTTGKGIIYNAIAVAGGFVALMFSQIRGNFYMGLLMAMIMVTASTFAITLLPAVIVIAKPKFIRKIAGKE